MIVDMEYVRPRTLFESSPEREPFVLTVTEHFEVDCLLASFVVL